MLDDFLTHRFISWLGIMGSETEILEFMGALPVIAFAALAAMWVCTPPLIRLCRQMGLFDHPADDKIHDTPTPRLGGVAIAIGLGTALLLARLAWPELVVDFSSQWYGILWGGGLILALGIYDDLWGAPAYLKLTTQIVAGLLLCLWGFQFDMVWIPFIGRINLGFWSIPLTVAWIVMLSNSINLIDGLDGLASGVAAIGGAFLAMVGILWNIPHVAVLGAAITGVCLGFLRYNYPPARIFMGDSGSLLLGFSFAVASVSVPIKTLTAISMALPLLAVWFPLFELVSSTIRRIMAGRSPLQADHGHWHHLLLKNGWSTRRIIWTYYVIALGCGLFVPALRLWDRYLVLPVFAVYCALVIGYLLRHAGPPGEVWKRRSRESSVEHARI